MIDRVEISQNIMNQIAHLFMSLHICKTVEWQNNKLTIDPLYKDLKCT